MCAGLSSVLLWPLERGWMYWWLQGL